MLSSSHSSLSIPKITSISILTTPSKPKSPPKSISIRFRIRCSLKPLREATSIEADREFAVGGGKTSVEVNSLRVLEWEKLCDVVSSFAGTSLGRQATKEQLWKLDQTYEESLRLLDETNAAVEIHKYGGGILNFACIDAHLVRSAVDHACSSFPVRGKEALAIASLLQFADTLQTRIKAAIRENADLNMRFMPLAEVILGWVINRSLAKLIAQVINEDGSVRDSASPKLRKARTRVQELETRLHQLMAKLISNEPSDNSSLEVTYIDGRLCITSSKEHLTSIKGLLLSSGSKVGSSVEPLSAIPLNDDLHCAKALVAEAEAEVLLDLTAKMESDLDGIAELLNSIIRLDMVNARATYSQSFGGTRPDLLLVEPKNILCEAEVPTSSYRKREWKLYLPNAYHPLLLQRHKLSLRKAQKDVADATAEIRRRRLKDAYATKESDINLPELQRKVRDLEDAPPVGVDFSIAKETRVLLITGPNTGGKTICLKTVGLFVMMAKSGLYILCSEGARLPWFDFVFADIGDEQSLSQSLSTFSGHLKQISDIRGKSTSQSLVLLDEIGAGTNPLEGAALGMSVLEAFADAGALLTIATTHHGELKTLKYSNQGFENACMEFDEVNLKPTYKILWGVPGRSNAINIAERLGLPSEIIDSSHNSYGAASAEINEVILDMEKFKQQVQEHVHKSEHFLKISKDLHEKLLATERKLIEHGSVLRYSKWQELSEIASLARSILNKKMQQRRASMVKLVRPVVEGNSRPGASISVNGQNPGKKNSKQPPVAAEGVIQSPVAMKKLPKVGDTIRIGKKDATVLQVEPSENEVIVQAGILKLKLKLKDDKL
ncbi:Endonuclease MutS2-like protein [Drosera capensis]